MQSILYCAIQPRGGAPDSDSVIEGLAAEGPVRETDRRMQFLFTVTQGPGFTASTIIIWVGSSIGCYGFNLYDCHDMLQGLTTLLIQHRDRVSRLCSNRFGRVPIGATILVTFMGICISLPLGKKGAGKDLEQGQQQHLVSTLRASCERTVCVLQSDRIAVIMAATQHN
jgi:hypothetical protein